MRNLWNDGGWIFLLGFAVAIVSIVWIILYEPSRTNTDRMIDNRAECAEQCGEFAQAEYWVLGVGDAGSTLCICRTLAEMSNGEEGR